MLKKSQHECKDLKNKYKQTILALKRSQLENHRHSSKVESLTLKCGTLEEENKKLNDQNIYFDERYNKYLIESMNTIKDLQDELQIIQELQSNTLHPKKDNVINIEEGILKEENEKLKLQVADVVKAKKKVKEENCVQIKVLQNKNLECCREISELKQQVNIIQTCFYFLYLSCCCLIF